MTNRLDMDEWQKFPAGKGLLSGTGHNVHGQPRETLMIAVDRGNPHGRRWVSAAVLLMRLTVSGRPIRATGD